MTPPDGPAPVQRSPGAAVTVPVTMDDTSSRRAPDTGADHLGGTRALPESAMWNVPAYLLAGMGGYGFLGWLADRFLGTSWLVLVGLLGGTAVALYTIWVRYGGRAVPQLVKSLPSRGADDQHPTRRSEEML